jgi:hypothetical protein
VAAPFTPRVEDHLLAPAKPLQLYEGLDATTSAMMAEVVAVNEFHSSSVVGLLCRMFCLASGNLTKPAQVSRLTDNLRRILEVAASTPRPFFASVHAREVHVSEGRLRPARYWARKRMSRKPSWRWPS